MRSRPSLAFRPRRLLAVAGLVSLGTGLLLLTAAAPSAGAAAGAGAATAGTSRATAHAATPAKPSRATVKEAAAQAKQLAAAARTVAVAHSSTTVQGPRMYNPLTGTSFTDPSTVTVTQTTQLVNQQVQVSWTNFTPSTALVYNSENVAYPVMVAECKGTDPASPADCYGAENGGVTSTSGKYGPMNAAYATTTPQGTGLTDVDILTKEENQFLGCLSTRPCSLAIVPSQGGNYSTTPPNCKDHSEDFTFGTGTAVGGISFGSQDFACSWAKRIMVPLKFARTAANCPFRNPVFSASGSPMLGRAMNSWVAALCSGSHGITIANDTTVAEPQALQELPSDSTDVALTTRSANSQGISTGKKKYLYAPVAVTAVSIAYWFDNATTGLPVTNIRLDQRLLLKLLTQSYSFENDGCPAVVTGLPCDGGVDRNPLNLFQDPEFLKYNPEYVGQNGLPAQVTPPPSAAYEVPTVASGQTDTTWQTTNWIAANKHATSLLKGQFDPWGMHLNVYYQGLQYPNNTFVSQDPFPFINHLFNPVFPLTVAATDQVENWPPSYSDQKDQFGNYERLPPQIPGGRSLIAVLDQGDSAAFLFPSAALPNGANKFRTPTTANMLAALQDMTSGGQGTKLVNPNSKNKKAYPLTMVVYAVVPTSGTSHTKAAAIARFLDFAVGAGQHPGVQPGQLPPGFAPLPASMAAQTRKDAFDVLHQTGATAPKNNNNGGNSGSSSSSSKHGKNSGSGSSSAATPSPGATGNPISLVTVADARPASISRYILPALLILGGLAALAGSSSLIGSSTTPISARLRRIGQAPLTWSRAARTRLGSRRSK
jgi:hypothetical protein